MKIKLTAHIHYRKYPWEGQGEYQLFYARLEDEDTLTYVCEREVEIEVPDDHDPRAQQIAALEKKKLEVMVKIFGRKTPLELGYLEVEKES